MRNSTRYTNRGTGELESGNYCAYVLMDYQLRMPDPSSPARGLFLGGTAMTAPSEFNPYDRYYEARLYQRGTFTSRPTDVLSVIASYRGHSHYFADRLVAEGKPVWRSSCSFERITSAAWYRRDLQVVGLRDPVPLFLRPRRRHGVTPGLVASEMGVASISRRDLTIASVVARNFLKCGVSRCAR
jgi:hypothetical protein